MRARLKAALVDVLPPALLRQASHRLRGFGWSGDYADWAVARAASSGYDAPLILERVTDAIERVRAGDAAYERDSVAFAEPDYAWPLLAGLLWAASRRGGRLGVVDFGGSLGSAYWQHRRFLDPLDVRWAVVEQPHFVARGRERFTDARLSFHETTAAARAATGAQLLLLSSVLQYLERPYDALAQFIDEGFPFVLIDRTPLLADRDRLTVQRVPRWIYPASYPCWFLSRARLLAAVAPRYEVVAEFPALDRATIPGSTFRGMLLERRGRAAASA